MQRINIVQGEHAVSGDGNVLITTLLGSCVAVCLYDGVARLGGMNHFLLGEPGDSTEQRDDTFQRYGSHAIEVLINALMKRGARRENLRAQIYGGANLIAGLGHIGSQNAAFALRFMETENISVGVFDTGGKAARRVEFQPFAGKARAMTVQDEVPLPKQMPQTLPTNDIELF
ncbi:chemotaxis protein CheD [Sphingorhabdus sp. M41]|nr:chemotaxis protein CheD [Sphingorhabdus sp. M41]AMO73445.1 chemotaxis protein CheD [Sphingorhabdus sp. M41]